MYTTFNTFVGTDVPITDTTDQNEVLWLNCNGDVDSTDFPDGSVKARGNASVFGTAKVSATNPKFGTGALWVDGNSDYLTFPDSTDWDIGGTNTENWTWHLWVKHDTYSADQMYLSQGTDGSNFMELGANATNLFWRFYASGYLINMDGGAISGGAWQHIALIKIGNDWGLYKDGTQTGYGTTDSTATYSSALNIGRRASEVGGSQYFDGMIDNIRLTKSNPFGASPNSGKTDTITVPTEE